MKFVFATLALGLATQANATSIMTFEKLYTCYNKAQMTDAPIVSIVEDQKKEQFVSFENRGSTHYVALKQADSIVIDGQALVSDDGTVRVTEKEGIEEPPARATVVVDGLGLTYQCTPAAAKL